MYAADLKHPDKTLEQKLHALYGLSRNKKIDLSFRPPYLELLQKFGNPHLALPPAIHVAGTNGKGSIVVILRSILERAGYKVHAYTSPHLLRFNERIVLAGREIEDDTLEALIDEATDLNERREVTFFEITTAMAFTAFSRSKADILLLETGLGGRLDCTNVIEKPLVSIINRISYDHGEYLGETLREIAAEKAGIMKKDVPCVVGAQSGQALAEGVMDVIKQKAGELNVPLYRAGQEWDIEPRGKGMRFSFEDEEFVSPQPSLSGHHQIENAGTAFAALSLIKEDFLIPPVARKDGLGKIKWPGRLQQIKGGGFKIPLLWELWFDGGHNDSAGEALAQQAKSWAEQDDKPLHIILGMKGDKDAHAFLKPLLPLIESLTVIPVPGVGDCLEAEDLSGSDIKPMRSENVQIAVSEILDNHEKPGRILICGSLYLAEQVLG